MKKILLLFITIVVCIKVYSQAPTLPYKLAGNQVYIDNTTNTNPDSIKLKIYLGGPGTVSIPTTKQLNKGTVLSITPGIDFSNHTPITTTGTLNIDTSAAINRLLSTGRTGHGLWGFDKLQSNQLDMYGNSQIHYPYNLRISSGYTAGNDVYLSHGDELSYLNKPWFSMSVGAGGYNFYPDSIVRKTDTAKVIFSNDLAADSAYNAATYMQKDSSVVRLPDIAALMAYTGAADVAVVAEKLRGGTFCRNAIGTDTVNNGITISSAIPGKIWKRQFNPGSAVNAAWFGAVGDGVTDNTSAIRSAILSRASKDIYFPNAQYPYIAQYIKWLDGNVFIGQSRNGVIIKKKDHTAGTVGDDNLFARYDKTSLGDVTISNMTIDGNYQNQDNRVYTISASAVNFYVDNVSFINTSTGAIFLQNTGKAEVSHSSFEHMQEHGDVFNETSVAMAIAESSISNEKRITNIHDNYFLADTPSVAGKAPGGIIITAGTNPHEHSIKIENNLFDGIGQNYVANLIGAVYEYSSSGLTHLVVKNNKFYHRRAAAIAVLAEYGSLCEGNYVEGVDSLSAATLGGVAAYNLAIKSSPAPAPSKTAYQFTNNMAIDQLNSNALSIAGRSDVNIDNVVVNNFKATNATNGIIINYAAGVTLDNVNMSGITSPISITNSIGTFSMSNSTIIGGNTTILARTGVTALNIAINNSHITGGTSYPITFRNGNTLIMKGNEISPATSAFIDAQTIGRVTLQNNYSSTAYSPTLTSSTNVFNQNNTWNNVTNGGVYYGNTSSGFQQTSAGSANTILHGGTTPSYSSVATGDIANSAVTLAKTSFLSGSATLDFPSTAAQTSSELTITVTGVADGDNVIVSPPNGSSNANSCFTARGSATNTVSVKFNNYSAGAIDPASGTFKITVIK